MEKAGEKQQKDVTTIQSLANIVARYNFWIGTKLAPPAPTLKDSYRIFRLQYKQAGGPYSSMDIPSLLVTNRQQEGANTVTCPKNYDERPNVITLRGNKGTVVLSSNLFGSEPEDILKCVRRGRPVINYRVDDEDLLPHNLSTLGLNCVKVFEYIDNSDVNLYPSEVSLVDSMDSFEEVVKQFA